MLYATNFLLSVVAVVAGVTLAVGSTRASDIDFDQIQRLATSDVIAVAHIRLDQVDLKESGSSLPSKDDSSTEKAEGTSSPLGRFVEALKAQEVEHVFLFFGIDSLGRGADYAAIHVSQPEANTDDLQRALLAVTGFTSFRRVEDMLLVARDQDVPEGDTGDISLRPQWTAALSALPNAAAVIAVVPSRAQREAIRLVNPQLPDQLGGESWFSLLKDVQWLAAGLRMEDPMQLETVIDATDDVSAKRLETWIRDQVAMIVSHAPGPISTALQELKVTRDGDRLQSQWTATPEHRELLAAIGSRISNLAIPSLVVESIARLRKVMLALVNHESAHGHFPAAASCDENGRPLLSWRVHILPFMDAEEQALYEQFRLDEPWDSPHNRKLIPQMPEVFQSPASKHPIGLGRANVIAPIGDRYFLMPTSERRIREMSDGVSRTIGLVEVGDARAEVWTQPVVSPTAVAQLRRHLGRLHSGGFVVALADARVLQLSKAIDLESLTFLMLCNDGSAPEWELLQEFRVEP